MASFTMETSEQMYKRAEDLATKYEIEKKDRLNFIEEKVKLWSSDQKVQIDIDREERAAKRAHEKELQELLDKDKERAHEKELQQIELEKQKALNELEMAKIKSTQNTSMVNQTDNDIATNLKRLRFAYFDGKTESIDSFFRTFEMQCNLEKIPKTDWTRYLMQIAKDKARTAMSYIKVTQFTPYEQVKKEMLEYFIKTPDHYRNKFHDIQLDKLKEPAAFIKDVEQYLTTWLELMNIDLTNPKEILDMMVYDKVLVMASDDLFSYLKERDIKSTEKLIHTINSFKDSHPNSELTKTKNNTLNAFQNVRRQNPQNGRNYNLNTRRHSYSPPKQNRNSGNDYQRNRQRRIVRCYYCNGYNHVQSNCIRRQNETQPKQYQSWTNNNQNQNVDRRHQSRKQKFTNSNWQKNKPNQSQNQNSLTCLKNFNGKLYLFPSFVNNIQTMALRDSGCTCLVVQEKLVSDEQYLNETEIITLGDGSSIECKCAIINIDTPWISGEIKAAVLKNCTAPLIIGNLTNIKPDNSFEIYEKWINEKTNITDIRKPTTLQEYNVKPIDTMIQNLNLLKANNVDSNKWTNNIQKLTLMKISENATVETKFPNWNGTEPISQYIDTFEIQCQRHEIPSELQPIILTQHLNAHKQAFNIANNNIVNFDKLKTELNKQLASKESNNSEEIQNEIHKKQQKQTICEIQAEVKDETSNFSFHNINHETLVNEQKKDKYIIKLIESMKNPNSYNFNKFKIQNNILIRICQNNDVKHQQIVVPETLKQTIMSAGHSSPLAGHLGTNKTYQSLLQNFWWKTMKKDIKRYTNYCDQCQRKNLIHAKHKAPIQKVDKIVAPFYKVAIDIIGPMTTTRTTKSRFALVLIDLATRWIEVVPLREITSERICNALLSIFTKYGFPNIILSDNGTQFVSNLTDAFAQLLDISQIFSTRYHPQSNGCVERANQTIKLMIEKVCIEKPKDWDIYLPMILFAYRNAKHNSTGFSPFQLMFGRQPKSPLENFKNNILQNKEIEYFPEEFISNVQKQITYANEIAKDNLEIASDISTQITNKNKHLRTLETNDLVLIYLPTGVGHNKEWTGPHKILKRINAVSYKVLVNNDERKFHINNLRKYNDVRTNEITLNCITQEVISEEEFDIIEEEIQIAGSQICLSAINCNKNTKEKELSLDHIKSNEFKNKLRTIITKYSKVISSKPGKTNIMKHSITLNDDTPFRSKTYVIPQKLQETVDTEIDILLKNKLIQKSNSQFSSPMVLVKKKNGDIRICCDYRKLNKVSNLDQEGLPNIEDIINKVGKGRIFSSIDLTRGFWQIPMSEDSKQYTAFTTHRGLFEWNVMPFGLVNSTATFTKMMRKILKPHPNIVHYVDDICIFSEDWKTHCQILEDIFNILETNNLTVSPDKIKIGYSEIEFLGHKFTDKGIAPTKNFQNKLLHIRTPTTKKHVRALIGLFNYYSKFITNYSQIVRPLIELTKKYQPQKVQWNVESKNALETLKQLFNKEPILTTLQVDDNVVLSTDASKVGLGACLMKETTDNGKIIYKPVQYLSRSLSDSEKKYPIIELECLAIFWSVRKLQRYLLGRHFTVFVDHKPLVNFNISNVNNTRINKYAMYLADYQFEIRTIRGKDNHIPDVLSRLSSNIPDEIILKKKNKQ